MADGGCEGAVKVNVVGVEEVIPQVISRQIIPLAVFKGYVLNEPFEVWIPIVSNILAQEFKDGSFVAADILGYDSQQIGSVGIRSAYSASAPPARMISSTKVMSRSICSYTGVRS